MGAEEPHKWVTWALAGMLFAWLAMILLAVPFMDRGKPIAVPSEIAAIASSFGPHATVQATSYRNGVDEFVVDSFAANLKLRRQSCRKDRCLEDFWNLSVHASGNNVDKSLGEVSRCTPNPRFETSWQDEPGFHVDGKGPSEITLPRLHFQYAYRGDHNLLFWQMDGGFAAAEDTEDVREAIRKDSALLAE